MTQVKRLQQIMNEKGVDGILVSSYVNQRYISGFDFQDGYVLVFRNKAYVLTDFRYIEAAEKTLNRDDFEIITKGPHLKNAVDFALENGASTILVEEATLSLSDFDRFTKVADGKVTYTSGASAIIDTMRLTKTTEELENIAKAQEITDLCFSHMLEYIKEDMTEIDVALEIEFYMRKLGAERISFETIAVSGKASSMPHGVPRNVKLERGFLTMDFGCVVNGYCSDMTRTISIGKATDEMKHLYDTVLKAQTAALEAAANGERGAHRLDEIARDIINGAGYEGRFGHSLGHGVGMYIHESPRLAPAVPKDEMLVSGNVVTFEPGIYIPDLYGCRIEDMVAITDDGIRNFTKSPKHLIELFA